MHFELEVEGDTLLTVSFKSSKESFFLGTLTFIDGDGDERTDVRELMTAALTNNPMFQIKR